jgi:hypothetical protein
VFKEKRLKNMRFQVPQFTDVEDKIVGPLTLKQFIYLAGGIGLCYVIYAYLPMWGAAPLMAGVGALSIALAFYKINNKPFIFVVEAFFKYMISSKLYIWKHEPTAKKAQNKKVEEPEVESYIPKLSSSKLKDLAWSLDVNKNLNSQEKIEN